jgi:orotate phosphoribosyltransferase
VRLHSLATWRDVLPVARQGNYFTPKAIGMVEAFLQDPAKWSAEHGGADKFPEE